jgi:hypothetical protein
MVVREHRLMPLRWWLRRHLPRPIFKVLQTIVRATALRHLGYADKILPILRGSNVSEILEKIDHDIQRSELDGALAGA